MSDQPPVDTLRLDASRREEAATRVTHVIVLMLENRSFDHLLGFSDLPDITPLDPSEHANPQPDGEPVVPNADGTAVLAAGPPHSHTSAMMQLGTMKHGVPAMNGFVRAYRQMLDGNENVPIVHWARIRSAGLILSIPLGFAVMDVVRHWWSNWDGLAWWDVIAPVVVLLALASRPLGRPIDISMWKIGLVGAALILVAVGASEGATHVVRHPSIEPLWWFLPALVLVLVYIEYKRAQLLDHVGPNPDAAELAPKVMACLAPEQLPVLNALAQRFALCERWFSSVPGATWPNRNFLHAGSSDQAVDIEIGLYGRHTLFELLDDEARRDGAQLTSPPWRIFRQGMPQVFCFKNLWATSELADRWCDMDTFYDQVAKGDLATYSFIEPCHSGGPTNSMHPANNTFANDHLADLDRGDRLIRDIYSAICATPGLWEQTLLLITFDEHGGTFDRVPPPKAVPPDSAATVRHPLFSLRRAVAWFIEHKNAPFLFRRYGVRVPTIIISPWIAPGHVDRHDYDHTSVSETVRQLFAPSQRPLSKRARHARAFWDLLLTSDVPREMPAAPPELPLPWSGDRRVSAIPGPGESDESPLAESGRPVTPQASPDSTTGGDIEAQLDRLNRVAREELAKLGAASIAESGTDAVDLYKQWAATTREA